MTPTGSVLAVACPLCHSKDLVRLKRWRGNDPDFAHYMGVCDCGRRMELTVDMRPGEKRSR